MSESSLLDRTDEMQALRRAVETVADGRGSVLLLEGPAGIGKTSLVEAVGPVAAEHDALVLGARASELDRGFAFGVVLQLLEPALDGLDAAGRERAFSGAAGRAASLFSPDAADTGASANGEQEFRILSGLFWLVANLADERPVVLRVDDLHWADVASVRFLEFLGRRIDDVAVLVVGSLRPNEPGAPVALLAELAATPATETLWPSALGRDAVATVLSGTLGQDPDPAFAAAAREATGGNPLLVSVLAREAAARGLRGGADDVGELTTIGARGVARVVERRLRSLGPDAERVARAVAIAGDRGSTADVAALAELPVDAVRAALDALVAVEVVAAGGRGFVHPLVRAAVIEATPHGERMRLHRECARRLRAAGARPAEVAAHWLAAAPARDPDVAADLTAAARVAAAEGATETAIDLLVRALDEPPTGEDGPRVLPELGELELRAHRPIGAERLEQALAAGLDARLRLAELLAAWGETEEALALADHDVAVARAAGTPGALGAALRVRARTLGTDDEAVELLREAVAVLAPGPMRMEHAWALHDLGSVLRRRGLRSDAREALRAGLDLAARSESVLLSRLIRSEIEASGGRPRRERTSGAEALTPSERRVADLAAEGLTNREIAESLWITRKTVEHHLGRAYAKLGISTRSGLAEALGVASPA